MTSYTSRYLDDREVQRRWLGPRLCAVRVADIRAYLERKGWVPVPPDRPHVLVFREPVETEDGPLYQFVPDSEQRRGYSARVYELLAAVAEVEGRSAPDVLAEVLQQARPAQPNGAVAEPVRAADAPGK